MQFFGERDEKPDGKPHLIVSIWNHGNMQSLWRISVAFFAQFPFIFSRQKNVPFFLTLTKSFSLKLAVKVIREPRGTHTALENKAKMDF